MQSNILEKNIPNWVDKSKDFLDDFISLYEKRPNIYKMKSKEGACLQSMHSS